MPTFNDARIRKINNRPIQTSGKYILYWLQMTRRLHANHALDYALHLSAHLKKPVVLYEAIKLNYPWASARHHSFMLQGMRDNEKFAKKLGLAYWPFVETPENSGHGLIYKLLNDACLLVTDDYPAYIVPAHNRALAARSSVPVNLVDSNSMVPLSLLGATVSAAAHLRPRIHLQFNDAWSHRAQREAIVEKIAQSNIEPPFEPWDSDTDIASFVKGLPFPAYVPPIADVEGGTIAGQKVLRTFITQKLPRYGEGRNQPDDPARSAASGLSPYLRYGHLAIQEVVEAVLGDDWKLDEINRAAKGKRDDFFCRDTNINSFLDEALTWRDVGYQWHWTKNNAIDGSLLKTHQSWEIQGSIPQFNFETFDFSPGGERTLEVVLPTWAKATLEKHNADDREFTYDLDEFEAGGTHDELWNAAQRELVATGRMHNYLRMLWAKKVLEWSATPAAAYQVLEHLNNKYAIDGRDPNSYTGILWCFGLFDRPWAPERKVFGVIRFMSSAATAKKFKLGGYYDYVKELPTIEQVVEEE